MRRSVTGAVARRPSRRGWLVALGLLVLLVTGWWVAPAAAHVEPIKRSDPGRGTVVRAVATISVEFTDSVRTDSATFVLRSSDGTEYRLAEPSFAEDATAVRLTPAEVDELPEGLYRLGYQVVFPDGHPAIGVVQFEVSRSGEARAERWPDDDPPPGRAEPDRLDVGDQLPWLIAGAVVLVAGFGLFLRRARRRASG